MSESTEVKLSENETKLVSMIQSFWAEHGYGPSCREMGLAIGLTSKHGSGAQEIVNRLIDAGILTRDSERETGKAKARTVRLANKPAHSTNSIAKDGVSVALLDGMIVFMLIHDGKVLESGLYTTEQVTNFANQYLVPANACILQRAFQTGLKHKAKLLKK